MCQRGMAQGGQHLKKGWKREKKKRKLLRARRWPYPPVNCHFDNSCAVLHGPKARDLILTEISSFLIINRDQ